MCVTDDFVTHIHTAVHTMYDVCDLDEVSRLRSQNLTHWWKSFSIKTMRINPKWIIMLCFYLKPGLVLIILIRLFDARVSLTRVQKVSLDHIVVRSIYILRASQTIKIPEMFRYHIFYLN